MSHYIFLGIGAILGSFVRYWLCIAFGYLWGNTIPAILLINWLGSFLFAFAAGLGDAYFTNFPYWRSFFLVGLLGSFTTFASFSFDILSLLQEKAYFLIFMYIFLSVGGGFFLALWGWHLGISFAHSQ